MGSILSAAVQRIRERELRRDARKLAVVTVRMPPALHARLKAVAGEQQVSMNALCVELLAAMVGAEDERK